MAVGVVEIDAMRIIFATVDFDASVFERRFDAFVIEAR